MCLQALDAKMKAKILKMEVLIMVISYKKLWKLLIDKDMKKKDLPAIAGISRSSITKMGHNENINTEILVKICNALECNLCDIVELVPNHEQQ